MEYAALHGIIWGKGTFWVAAAVFIFLVLSGRQIVGFIVKMLDDRSMEIRRQFDEATRLRTEAEAMQKDAEARKQDALAQARDMLVAASHDAELLAAKLISDAHAVATRREQMVAEQIAAARNAAMEDIRKQAASLACRAAEIVLRQTIDTEQGNQLINSAIASLPEAFQRGAAH
jgi:F-type H+-transporting ATPase subunit b